MPSSTAGMACVVTRLGKKYRIGTEMDSNQPVRRRLSSVNSNHVLYANSYCSKIIACGFFRYFLGEFFIVGFILDPNIILRPRNAWYQSVDV